MPGYTPVSRLKHPDAAHHSKSGFASTQGAGGWSYERWTYPSGTTGTTLTNTSARIFRVPASSRR